MGSIHLKPSDVRLKALELSEKKILMETDGSVPPLHMQVSRTAGASVDEKSEGHIWVFTNFFTVSI